ncbi:MAG: DUF1573 domain-containing protein [Planctomycetes bacterium]|nr:DUF1573 domain-containing protein [Planctomycetota bacterium]
MAEKGTKRWVLLLTTFGVLGVAIGYLVAAKHSGEASVKEPDITEHAGVATVKPSAASEVTPTNDAPKGPCVAFDETIWRFDSLFSGEKVEHRFAFRNAGDGTLRIFGVKTTCGCTVAEASRMALEPGESADVRVVFDSTNRAGDVQKTITVSTNDVRAPHVPLELTGRILEECWSEPGVVEMGDIQRGEAIAPRHVRVLALKSRNVKIEAISPCRPGIAVTKTPLDLPNATGFDLALTFADWQCLVSVENPNLLDSWIDVTTTSTLQPNKRVHFTGQVVDDVLVEPGVLTFKPLAHGDQPELTATIRCAPTLTIHPTITDSKSAAIEATLEPLDDGHRFRIHVKVKKDSPTGRFHDVVTVLTGAPTDPHVRVDVYGDVKP